MRAIIMELHNSWKWVVLIKLQLSCNELQNIYKVNCSSTIHATYLLTFMAYKYIELQVSFAIQKLSYKANCKTLFFFIMKFSFPSIMNGQLKIQWVKIKGGSFWGECHHNLMLSCKPQHNTCRNLKLGSWLSVKCKAHEAKSVFRCEAN
jgi:hypothetical protein